MSASVTRKILFIVKSEKTPSSRIRAVDLIPGLRADGLECEIEYLPKSFFARYRLFRRCADFDVVVFQKCLLSLIEFRELRVNAKKLVFDFDDAVYMRNASPSLDPLDYISNTRTRRFKRMVNGSDLVVAANSVLSEIVKFHSPASTVEIIPSSVPVAEYEARDDYALGVPPVIGWLGSGVTMRYLEFIGDELRELRGKRDFLLRVVSNAEFVLDGVRVENIKWSLDTQAREIRRFDIGVMPLSDDPFSEGKSSYKLLQYMACGIPSVASAVGMNIDVAEAGRCAIPAESRELGFGRALEKLLEDRALRERIGRAARSKVESEFDRRVVSAKLAAALKRV